ncbi:MAG: type II toxin-antitoxin system RelE/ParE family toxin [Candidatus Saccharibacteria bacterium]
MAQVKWRERAIVDIEHLHSFLYEKDNSAASKMALTISHAASLLETSPRIGRPMGDETGRRELFIPFGAGAYVIRYKLLGEDTVLIIRVWHNKETRTD